MTVADVSRIEVSGERVRCPACRRLVVSLLVLGGGRLACAWCTREAEGADRHAEG